MTSKSAERKDTKKKVSQATSKPKATKAKPTPADGGPASKKPTEPTTPAAPRDDAQPKPNDTSEIVVFAFRLSRAERDLIHEAAGSAKASKFVRGIALAAARGDSKEIKQVMQELQTTG